MIKNSTPYLFGKLSVGTRTLLQLRLQAELHLFCQPYSPYDKKFIHNNFKKKCFLLPNALKLFLEEIHYQP